MEVRATLNADPRCVAEARQLTSRTLQTWGLAALCDVAALLVSELTTNAFLHARSGVVLTLQAGAEDLRVFVCDNSPHTPRVQHFSADAATGRGVRLLESLASAWGVQSTGRGKCVWFALPLRGEPAAAEWDFDLEAVDPL